MPTMSISLAYVVGVSVGSEVSLEEIGTIAGTDRHL